MNDKDVMIYLMNANILNEIDMPGKVNEVAEHIFWTASEIIGAIMNVKEGGWTEIDATEEIKLSIENLIGELKDMDMIKWKEHITRWKIDKEVI